MTRALAMVLVLAVPSAALAWEPIAGSRPVWSGPAPYQLNQAGSADLGVSVTEAEVRRGMDDWTTPACSGLSTSYGGMTSRQPGTYEGESVIGWIESGWRHSSSAIGVTGTRYTSSRIIEADMEMNGVHFQWTTDPGSGNRVNAYSIALHEGGHYIGLGHSSTQSAAMYYAYSGGLSRLGSDDEAGVCTLYPGGGGAPADCSVTGCPAGQRCVGGACVADDTPPPPPPPPGGGVCAPCSAHSGCGGAEDYCLSYPDGNGYCGRACASDGDCAGDRCQTLSNGARQCVRYSGSTPSCAAGGPSPGGCTTDSQCAAGERCDRGACVPGGGGSVPLGGACAAHGECASGTCFSGVCTQTCDWPAGGCPTGFYCDGLATGACGAGVCLAGSPGPRAVGEHCSDNADCENHYCFLGRCEVPCNPEQVGACPGGGACQVGALACRGACGPAGSLGDPCDANAACASGMCAASGDDRFCTQLCDPSSPCPEGYGCTSAGAVNVCVPNGGALGGDCARNEDCATGICAFEEDRAYCTRICDPASPCPSHMQCVASGTPGLEVCQPRPGEDPRGGQGRRRVEGCSAAAGPGGAPLPLGGLLFGCAVAALRRRARLSPLR
ncbi:MAG: matrixin family metalloprotease [Sandaracinaceae bacterium]|nr:matrixin family metalloprotease [Sandaracinaceae bacterium]